MSILKMLFSANGRLRRRDYWVYGIAVSIISVVLNFVGHQLLSGHDYTHFVVDMASWAKFEITPFTLYIWGLWLAFRWPGICISAKRWHDRGRSGYLAGAYAVFTIANLFIQSYYAPTSEHKNALIYGIALATSFIASIWVFIDCGCLDGTKGPNKYGPSPKGVGAMPDVF